MPHQKTWTFSLSTTPILQDTSQHQSQSFWIQLKEFLINSGGWTVVSSSDGATYSSSTDLWGTTLSNLVWNTSNAARSWILLKSPEGIVAGADGSYTGEQSRTWLCFALTGTTNASYGEIALTYHRVAPTGGSTSAVPTSASSVEYPTTAYRNNAAPLSLFHFGVVSTGEGTPAKGKGAFYAIISSAGGYNNSGMPGATSFLSVIPITNTNKIGSLDYPYATGIYLGYSGNSQLNVFNSYLMQSSQGWSHDGTPSTAIRTGYIYISSMGLLGVGTGTSGNAGGINESSSMPFYTAAAPGKYFWIGDVADFFFTGADMINTTTDSPTNVLYVYLAPNLWIPVDKALNLT